MTYYFGIYVEYESTDQTRIAQVMESVDDLSCEMLANPGLVKFTYSNRNRAKEHAKHLARKYDCSFIEFGWGNYKLIRIKPAK